MKPIEYTPCRCGGPKCPPGAVRCPCEECRPGPGTDYRARHALVQANKDRKTAEELERLVRMDPKMLTRSERSYLRNVFSD